MWKLDFKNVQPFERYFEILLPSYFTRVHRVYLPYVPIFEILYPRLNLAHTSFAAFDYTIMIIINRDI